MKVEFLETKAILPKIEKKQLKKILIEQVVGKKIVIFSTLQFLDSRNQLAEILSDYAEEVIDIKLAHCKYNNQMLGCSALDNKIDLKGAELIFYVGDGSFHPKSLILSKTVDLVYCLDPISLDLTILNKEDILKLDKKRKGALTSFIIGDNIGILVTTKPGQNNIKKALELKNNPEYKEKNFYLFLDDSINFAELENFNFIDCWVNTACPRIAYDDAIKINRPILNVEDIKSI
jgi:2-(3-amino-3-carboxypropyl)histidine synthase